VGADRPFGLGVPDRAGLDRRGHRPPGTQSETPRRQRDPHHPHPPVLVRLLRAQYRSPLGRRPYDLRHAAVSLWLNSGVPATEVARRAGHGVAVLLKIYAHCIDGQATAANQRITEALGIRDVEPDPGDEDDGDIEQAS
jgi:integrase